MIFLCRFCGSSYKHKKSLNKHWKDKHADVPRPQGAQADDDDEDEDDDDEDEDGDEEEQDEEIEGGEKSDTENVPPSNAIKLCTKGVTQHLNGAEDANVDSYPCVDTRVKFRESTQRVTSAERAALRRISAPISRQTEKSIRPRRISFLPDSGGKRETASYRASVPLKRRFRNTDDPGPTGSDFLNNRADFVYRGFHEPTNKRRQSNIAQHETYQSSESGTHLSVIKENAFDTVTRSSFVQRKQDEFDDKSTLRQTPARSIIPDSQPLDLSVLRSIDSPQTEVSSSQAAPITDANSKNKQAIDVSLLIGLLQTALNTLTTELRESQKRSTEGPISTNNLSRTSISLLLAIGTLLVSIVDNKGDMGTARSLSPKIDPESCKVENCIASRQSVPSITCSTPPNNPMVLPPAPASAFISPAIESHPFEVDNYRPKTDHMALSFSPHTDLARTTPTQSVHNTDIHTEDSSSAADGLTKSRSNDYISTLNNFVVTQPTTPLWHSRSNIKSGATVTNSSTSSVDNVTKMSRQTEDPKSASESQHEYQIICPVCNFDARWFSELRAHMVNHSEHRMFGCCFCTYRAKWKWDVAKHMRRCPLGRHVAHLSNEALLRIVRYHPPPKGNILYNYFPQDGFPGVGLDRPPTPPPYPGQVDVSVPGQGRGEHQKRFGTVTNRTDNSPADDPPLLTRQGSSDSQSDVEADPSPHTLNIVDGMDSNQQKPATLQAASESYKTVSFRPPKIEPQNNSEVSTKSLPLGRLLKDYFGLR